MEPTVFQPSMLLAILPEIGLLVLAGVVLALDIAWRESGSRRRTLGWVTAGGLLVVLALAIAFARPADTPQVLFGGMLALDGLAFVFRLIFVMGAAMTALFMMDHETLGQRGEFYAMLLVAAFGMNLMASATDLVMLYLAIEVTSLPLYVMAGFKTRDPRSAEAGIKYFIFGAMTSAVMLYGFSLMFGLAGTTNLYGIRAAFGEGASPYVLVLSVVLVLVGFGFKVSAVPFHFWAPDVYEGAPTPVAGFLSTASKAAGFAVLLRVLALVISPNALPGLDWRVLVAILAAASMIVGNILAIVQKNVKRLLAYSSIAQAGYMLVGVAAGSALGAAGVTFYLLSYLVTNMAAFGIVELVGRTTGSDDLQAYAGLQRRNPGLALALLVAMLSLGGVPPLSGFIGKLLVFGAAVQAGGLGVILAFIGVLTSVVGLYYYLNILKIAYMLPLAAGSKALPMPMPWRVALVLCVILILFMGTVIGPWFGLSTLGANGLF